MIRSFVGAVLALTVLVAGACSREAKDSAFCKSARQSVPQLETAYASLSEATLGASAQVDLEQARADYAAAVDAVIKTLDDAPEEIRTQATATVEGLNQQLGALAEAQAGNPPAPFPTDRQAAANQVDAYLRSTCEVPGSVAPR